MIPPMISAIVLEKKMVPLEEKKILPNSHNKIYWIPVWAG